MSRDEYGDGTIYEYRGRWYAEWTDPNGRRKKFSAKTKREVKRKLAEYKESVARGARLDGADETVADYLARWLQTIHTVDHVRPSTRKAEMYHLAHVSAVLGDLTLGELRADDIDTLVSYLRGQGKKTSSIQTVVAVFRAAIKDAVRRNLIERDPFLYTQRIKNEQTEERASLSLSQIHRLLHETAEDDLHALWVLLITTGLRIGEALALRWSDIQTVDLLGDVLYVRRTVTRDEEGRPTMGPPKTPRSRAMVPLMPLTVDALADHRKEQRIVRMAAEEWDDNDLVFSGPDGRAMRTNRARRELSKTAQRLGLPSITPHALRHSLSRIFREQGVDPLVARDVLRHQSVATTFGDYGHFGHEERRRVLNALDETLRGERQA